MKASTNKCILNCMSELKLIDEQVYKKHLYKYRYTFTMSFLLIWGGLHWVPPHPKPPGCRITIGLRTEEVSRDWLNI